MLNQYSNSSNKNVNNEVIFYVENNDVKSLRKYSQLDKSSIYKISYLCFITPVLALLKKIKFWQSLRIT